MKENEDTLQEHSSRGIYFETLLKDLKEKGSSKSEQGTLFELFCKRILEVAPFFRDDVLQVWMWKDFPGNGGKHDTGIDLVVLDKRNRYWAVQCKFYDFNSRVSKSDIDSFISASDREFFIDGKTHRFDERLVFSTTEDVSLNASGLFQTFGPASIFECGIDWEHFVLDDIASMKAAPIKTPREHQKKAIEDVLNGFKDHDRGKLIMACGTGKTYTSLKIVEGLYREETKSRTVDISNSYNILYLVPSIALLSQTILEWKTQQQFGTTVRTFGVCSDATAAEADKGRRRKSEDELLVSMPIRATTNVDSLRGAFDSGKSDVNIFFSTYQSIDVIS